jgi:hypothetical protein
MHNHYQEENRVKEKDWFIIKFSDYEIEEAKKIREEKDKNLGENRFNSETRWVGYLGEIAFRYWLRELGLKHTYWDFRDRKDKRDFTLDSLEIDVKTIATNYYPKMHYSCAVLSGQVTNEVVNTYVFVRYILPTNIAIVMGWLSKKEFLERADEKKKGTVTNSNFKVPADMLDVRINELRPLIDLDRYR